MKLHEIASNVRALNMLIDEFASANDGDISDIDAMIE